MQINNNNKDKHLHQFYRLFVYLFFLPDINNAVKLRDEIVCLFAFLMAYCCLFKCKIF